MAINRQDSRHRIKRTNLTGVVPTAHTASTDFTDGTWLNTDIREAEFFYNIPDKKLWIGTGTSSIEIAQIGSTTSGNSLEQTLSIGNNSGTNNIIMGTATVIKSDNTGGRIALDASSVAGEVYITTDDGSEATSYLKLSGSGQTAELAGIPGYSYISIGGNSQWFSMDNVTFNSIKVELNSSSRVFNVNVSDDTSGNGGDTIKVVNNVNNNASSDTGDKLATIIGSNNGTIGTASYNTVILGGTNMIANTSNSVYVPDLYIQTNKSIKSTNGGGQIDLDYMSSFLALSTDNGTFAESYIILGTNSWYTGSATNYLQGIAGNLYLATDGLNNISGNRVSIGGNGTVSISSSTGDIKLVTDTGKSVEISTGTSIKSENGGAAISLDTYGLAKNIFISNDGVGMESSIEMTPSSFSINNSTGNLTLSSSTYSISMLSNVEMSVGKLIKSASGGSQIDLNPGGDNWISLTTDSGAYSTSYIDMASTYVDISTNNGACEIYLDGTETTISGDDVVVRSGSSFVTSIPGSIQLESGTYSTYVQSLQFRKASKSQSTATSSTIASIPMVDGETITIEAKVNAVCTYPNRNYGARLMAVFLKYGGTIYQTGTTDIVAKDGFGDGTTTTIDTDGTNVRIRVTNGSGVTTRWATTYDYLQSS